MATSIIASKVYMAASQMQDGRPSVDVSANWADGTYGNKSGYTIDYQRAEHPSGSWKDLGNTANVFWTDFSPPEGKWVRYRCRSRWNGKTSTWSAASEAAAGLPPAPTGITTRWVSSFEAEVSFNLAYDSNYPMGDIWVLGGGHTLASGPKGTRTIRFWTPNGATVAFSGTIRTQTTEGLAHGGFMYRDTAFSIPALKPHGAPTVQPVAAVAEGSDVTVTWTTNAPSGDAQTGAVLTVDGERVEVEGATTRHVIHGLPIGRHTVTVQTAGLTGTYGPQTVVTVVVAGLPTVTVYGSCCDYDDEPREPSPDRTGDPLTSLPARICFLAEDELSGVASAILRVYGPNPTWLGDAPDPLYSQADVTDIVRAGASPAWWDPSVGTMAWDFGTDGIPVNATYHVVLEVSNGVGLTATGGCDLRLDVPAPSRPRLEVAVDEGDLSATVTVRGTRIPYRAVRPSGATVASAAGSVPMPWSTGEVEPADYFDVYRVYDRYGEVTRLLASGIADGDSVVDPWPPLNTPFTYRAVARSSRGGTSVGDCEVVVDSHGAGAINFGDGLGRVALCRLNDKLDRERATEARMLTFRGDRDERTGRVIQHAYLTGVMADSESVTFAYLSHGTDRPGVETYMDALAYGTVLWRNPYGERWPASLAGSWSNDAGVWGATDLSATLARVADVDLSWV